MASKTLAARRAKTRGPWPSVRVRVLFVLFLLAVALSLLVTRLVFLQVFDSSGKSAAQVDQLIDEVKVTAQRGDIYDRNMNVLVKDSSAKSVNVIPKQVKDPEALASKLSESLGLDYDKAYAICVKLEDDKVEVTDNIAGRDVEALMASLNNGEAYFIEGNSFLVIPEKVKDAEGDAKVIAATFEMDPEKVQEYLTSRENSAQVIKSKVDNSQAEEIAAAFRETGEDGETVSNGGVELIDDQKRYYTNGNFMSYILGFTGDDHEGLYGVEKTFDDTLSGTDGIVYYQKDASGNIITSQTRVIQEAVKGEDLVLSIDSNIQSAAEKALEGCLNTWHAKSATGIIMNVKTGEIVAMASKPDYDLNNPYDIPEAYRAAKAEELAGQESLEQVEQMWRNPAVSFIYEPGSTFKPITVATALEEGAINPGMSFECDGAITVAGTTIHCTGIHGVQTIGQTLENSCNPGLIRIIQDVDPNTFYKYVYNFGFGEGTGIELTGEEDGIINRIFNEDGTFNIVDYSTFSFGQGLATTPIQLITALNALVNNGNYVAPTIVKSEDAPQTRQIVSESTSKELRKDMQGVLESKSELKKLINVQSMGGKTGTAEKFVDGAYSSTKYVTSFFCFAPVDDPKYCCLVALDEPSQGAAGATSAAPTAIEMLNQALLYTGSVPSEQVPDIVVPDCVGQKLGDAKKVLDERGIPYTVEGTDRDDAVITSQNLPALGAYERGQTLTLSAEAPENGAGVVPDFTGMTVQSVNEKVSGLGMVLEMDGAGFAIEQSVPPGTPATPDAHILVRFNE